MIPQYLDDIELALRGVISHMGTWGDVAQKFRELGVTGVCGSVYSCPVANYVSSQIDEEVSVSGITVTAFRGHEYTPNVVLPLNVVGFVDGFDGGEFPDLVTPKGDN